MSTEYAIFPLGLAFSFRFRRAPKKTNAPRHNRRAALLPLHITNTSIAEYRMPGKCRTGNFCGGKPVFFNKLDLLFHQTLIRKGLGK